MSHRYLQHGITLIEVMVTTVILIIGLLAIFQLHIVAKRSTLEAYNYNLAVTLANDMIERMRVNSTELSQYEANNYGSGTYTEQKCESVGKCSVNELIAMDQYQWHQQLSGQNIFLAEQGINRGIGAANGMTGCIEVNEDITGVTVIVAWQGTQDTTDAIQQTGIECGTAGKKRRQVVIQTTIIAGV